MRTFRSGVTDTKRSTAVKTLGVMLGALATLVALVGCGGTQASSDSKEASSPSASTKTPEAPKVTLKDTCPQVEQALTEAVGDDFVPSPEQLAALGVSLTKLSTAGDVETQNAIALMTDADAAAVEALKSNSALDASDAFDNGISAFADRCKAAGSSALQ